MRIRTAFLIIFFLVSSVPKYGQGPLSQSTSDPKAALDIRVRAEVAPFKGRVFLYAKNLDTGQTYSLNGDERVRTASTIKIAVMIEAFARVADGRAKWTDELVLTKAARYGGSGILPEVGDGFASRCKTPCADDGAQRQHGDEHGPGLSDDGRC